jgi:arylsulfatase A-like enzyme
LLISIDALRYDSVAFQRHRPHLDALGLMRPATPWLDRLVAGSFQFSHAAAHAPYTTVSHATILTGLLPPEHGVRTFMETSLSESVQSLAERFRDAGYGTMLMSDELRLFLPVGLDRGFDEVTDDLDAGLTWWRHETRPKFGLIHLYDVHAPYGFVKGRGDPARNDEWTRWVERHLGPELTEVVEVSRSTPDERVRLRRLKSAWQRLVRGTHGLELGLRWYLAGLAWFDAGRLRHLVERLDALGVFDDTILTVFGDHGEGHDPTYELKCAHACMMFDDVIRVPLSIRHPRAQAAAQLIGDPCGLADLAPTLLELAGLDAHIDGAGTLSGRSLVPLLRGRSLPERPVYGEYWRRRWDPERDSRVAVLRHRMLRSGGRKFSLIGRHVRAEPLESLDAEKFTQAMYHDVLGRHADAKGSARYRWWARLGPLARRQLLRRVARSAEARRVPKYGIAHLIDDPTERRIEAVTPGSRQWGEFARVLDLFDALDAEARPGGPLRATGAEAAAVEQRLQDLGYLD